MIDTVQNKSLTADSRIWIYQADRFLNDQEIININKKLEGLLAQWNTHGKPLAAEAWVEERLFLILAVDESKQYASGCSIDQSTNFIRTIGNRLNVDFFYIEPVPDGSYKVGRLIDRTSTGILFGLIKQYA